MFYLYINDVGTIVMFLRKGTGVIGWGTRWNKKRKRMIKHFMRNV